MKLPSWQEQEAHIVDLLKRKQAITRQPMVKTNVGFVSGMRSPLAWNPSTLWPRCSVCNDDLDAIEVVETTKCGAKVLGKHHGCEELANFDCATEHFSVEEDVMRLVRSYAWFLPNLAINAVNDR